MEKEINGISVEWDEESVKIHKGQKPKDEQIEEIQAATKLQPVFDEEAPELSLEQLQRYRAAAIRKRKTQSITLEISDSDFEKAKTFGTGYREVLSKLLALAMKDPELIGKAKV